MKYATLKLALLIAVVAGFVAWWYVGGLNKIITFDLLKSHALSLQQMIADNYIMAAIVFVAIYTAVIAAALPVSPAFTLLGSYLFGFLAGFTYSFIACILGATISFLVIRYVVKRWMTHYTPRVEKFNEQFKKYGASYLLMLHFLSIIPYVVITVLASLANVPLSTFVWTLIVGSAPLLILYSWTGKQLATVQSVHDIFSTKVLVILAILIIIAILPIFLRRYKHHVGL